jgi:hypothetical protein
MKMAIFGGSEVGKKVKNKKNKILFLFQIPSFGCWRIRYKTRYKQIFALHDQRQFILKTYLFYRYIREPSRGTSTILYGQQMIV